MTSSHRSLRLWSRDVARRRSAERVAVVAAHVIMVVLPRTVATTGGTRPPRTGERAVDSRLDCIGGFSLPVASFVLEANPWQSRPDRGSRTSDSCVQKCAMIPRRETNPRTDAG